MLLTYKTILSHKSQLNSNTYLYDFDLLEPREIVFKPGQYLMLKVPSEKGPISRLYSIASPNTTKGHFQLIIEIVPGGLASNYLFSLAENAEVVFQGPAGVFSLKENEREKIFLVTGTGIAPAISMLTSNNQSSIKLFWGMKNYKDIYLFEELKRFNPKICLSREQNLDMVPEADKKFFDLGHVDVCFEKLLITNDLLIANSEFYVCGARQVVESLKLFLLSKSILQENIHFEKF